MIKRVLGFALAACAIAPMAVSAQPREGVYIGGGVGLNYHQDSDIDGAGASGEAEFDLMVEDLDATHAGLEAKGLEPSKIEAMPAGRWLITVERKGFATRTAEVLVGTSTARIKMPLEPR